MTPTQQRIAAECLVKAGQAVSVDDCEGYILVGKKGGDCGVYLESQPVLIDYTGDDDTLYGQASRQREALVEWFRVEAWCYSETQWIAVEPSGISCSGDTALEATIACIIACLEHLEKDDEQD